MEGALTILLAFLVAYIVLLLLYCVLYIIGAWRVFTKAGEPGWKSLIPIYNSYITYRISWNVTMFWIMLALLAAGAVLTAFENTTLNSIGSLCTLAAGVFNIIDCYRLSQAYGHGILFAIGLVLFNPVFLIILGFGSSRYIGPQE